MDKTTVPGGGCRKAEDQKIYGGCMEEYTTLAGSGQDEFVERRSRFIGSIRPVTTEEEAIAVSYTHLPNCT